MQPQPVPCATGDWPPLVELDRPATLLLAPAAAAAAAARSSTECAWHLTCSRRWAWPTTPTRCFAVSRRPFRALPGRPTSWMCGSRGIRARRNHAAGFVLITTPHRAWPHCWRMTSWCQTAGFVETTTPHRAWMAFGHRPRHWMMTWSQAAGFVETTTTPHRAWMALSHRPRHWMMTWSQAAGFVETTTTPHRAWMALSHRLRHWRWRLAAGFVETTTTPL